MAKVLVLYQSSWGHMEQMANAAAEGARAGGAQVAVKRVPELMSEDAARRAGMKWSSRRRGRSLRS
jgi:NAD(P)H dehydrogenase (quinone)